MKRRAGWWWIDRWRKSTAYTDMTAAEQGVYRNLLDELWLRDGVIPADERILAKISGDHEAWPKVRKAVLARFYRDGDNYRNSTHDEISVKTDEALERQRTKGQKRAEGAVRTPAGKFQPIQPEDQPEDQPEASQDTSRETSRETSLPDPYSVLRTPDQEQDPPTAVGRQEDARLRPANPHVDVDGLRKEGNALIQEIAERANLDPGEVIAKASLWRGHSYVRLDVMSDDRLIHTVNALRSWARKLRGEPEPALPVAEAPGRTVSDRNAQAVARFLARHPEAP